MYGDSVKDVADDIERLKRTGGLKGLGKAVGFEQALPGVSAVFNALDASMTNLQVRLEGLDQVFTQVATSQGPQAAEAAFAAFAHQVNLTDAQTKELRGALPNFNAALLPVGPAAAGAAAGLGQVGGAASGAIGATKEYATAADAAAAAARGQRDALTDLAAKMTAEANPVFGLIEAEEGLAEAKKKSAKAIKEHGRDSEEAKAATRNLTLAAIELQDKAGALGATFDGKMTPAMRKTLQAAGLTEKQIEDVATQFRQAKTDADKYDGNYAARTSAPGAVSADKQIKDLWEKLQGVDGDWTANIHTKGYEETASKLRHLLAAQQAAKDGVSFNEANREIGHFFLGRAGGGPVYGPGTDTSDSIPARLSNNEYVIQASATKKVGVGALDYINKHGELPAMFAMGGPVVMPFPFTTAKTKIPAAPAGPTEMTGSGPTDRWILATVHSHFPLMPPISVYRPGSRTLSGNVSYHARHRAVDWPASHDLAVWWNQNFMSRTKEFISPWNELNIHNGKRHSYTGAVYRQHSGSNAHDHIAMAQGGVIREPVMGVGRSGRTYSFAENGPETVIPGYARGGLVNVAPSEAPQRGTRLDSVEAYIGARNAVAALSLSLRENGRDLRLNTRDGIENRSALNAGVRAAQDAAKAKYAETGSIRAANAEYQKHLRALKAVLVQQKVNSVTARQLVNSTAGPVDYGITPRAPKDSTGNIAFIRSAAGAVEGLGNLRDKLSLNLPGIDLESAEGRENILAIVDFLEGAGKVAQDRFTQTGSSKAAKKVYDNLVRQLRASLADAGYNRKTIDRLVNEYGKITLQRNADGGVYGGLTQSTAYGPGNTLYAFREPSTGGEAFVARNGPRERSERVLAIAAGWHGGRYVSGGGQGGSSVQHSTSLTMYNYGDRMTDGDLQRAQRRLDAKARVGRPR